MVRWGSPVQSREMAPVKSSLGGFMERFDKRMLDVGSRVMHAFSAIMTEASNNAENHTQFLMLVRQAFSVARRMLKQENLTFADIYVDAEYLRRTSVGVRGNFKRRMDDPEWDACFNPERHR